MDRFRRNITKITRSDAESAWTLRISTDVGNVVRLDLKSLTAKDLGRMVREPGADLDPTIDLLAGDLVINGYSIRGTALTDDFVSSHDARAFHFLLRWIFLNSFPPPGGIT